MKVFVRVDNSLPTSAKYGDQLIGSISFGTNQLNIPITYIVPIPKPSESKPDEAQVAMVMKLL